MIAEKLITFELMVGLMEDGYLSMIIDLVDKYPDIVNKTDNAGVTLLMWAARNGYTDIANILINARADVDKSDDTGMTALLYASSSGNVGFVRVLIAAGADINIADNDGWTALMVARNYGVVAPLISAEADVNKVRIYKCGSFWYSTSALICAVKRGDYDTVEALIKAGADINKPDKCKVTPLIHAIQRGWLDVVEYLITAGADVNKADKFGATALMYSIEAESADIARLLIVFGANVNMTDSCGRTALWYCKGDNITEYMILLKQALNKQNHQDSIKYIKIIFRQMPFALSILFSSLNKLISVLKRIDAKECDDTLKKALRHFLMLPQPSCCDESELDLLIVAIRKKDNEVDRCFERAAMTFGLFKSKSGVKLPVVPDLREKIISMLPFDKVCMLRRAYTS